MYTHTDTWDCGTTKSTGNAFDWQAPEQAKPAYPQLSYYHRAMAAGTRPRKLRSLGLPVVDRRFKANKGAL